MDIRVPTLRRLCYVALLAGASLACSATAPAPERRLGLLAQIEREAGDAACDGPQQCHSIAIGAKTCGGPARYLAWSSKRSDGERLRQLAAQYAEESRRNNAAEAGMSTCSLVTDPGATCQAERCVLLPRGLGGNISK